MQTAFEGLELLPQTQFVEALRMIMDETEIATIRKACPSQTKLSMMLLTLSSQVRQRLKCQLPGLPYA